MTEKAKATYEARYCPGIPTDCCDYGVISHETGKEVCRVWARDDAERITDLLNTRHPTPDADVVEVVARAICGASNGQWRTNEGLSEQAIKIQDNDALNNHWRYVARAAIAALQSRPAEPAGEEPTCWMIRSRETGIPFWGFVQNHYRSKEEAEKSAQALYDYEPFALYARPATPTNPERLVEGKAAEAIRKAFFTSVSGGSPRYHLSLAYQSIGEMHEAEDAIKAWAKSVLEPKA